MYGLSVCVCGGALQVKAHTAKVDDLSAHVCSHSRDMHVAHTPFLPPPHLLFIISKGRGRVQVDLRAHTSMLLPCCRSLRPHRLREVTVQPKNSFS